MTEETSSWHPRWADIGVIVAVTPILLAAARVLLFSGGDPTLFRVLVQTLNVPTVLLGTSIAVLPVVALLPLFMVATEPSALRYFARAPWFSFTFFAYFVLAFVAIVFGPWPSMGWSALLVVIVFLGFWSIRRLRHAVRAYRRGLTARSAARASLPVIVRAPTEAWKDSAWAPLVIVALTLVSLQSMWLPLERVVLVDGEAMTGFVMEERPEWTTFLTDQRAVHRIPTDQMEERTVCSQGEFSSLFMSWANSAPEDAPTC